LDRGDDLLALLGWMIGRRVGEHIAHHLRRIRRVMHECLGANRDLVAEQGRDLVRVPRATDVAQQRYPVSSF
jgi:hypothetical protein